MSARVLIPIADGFEEIETVTVVDMLRRAEVKLKKMVKISTKYTSTKPFKHYRLYDDRD